VVSLKTRQQRPGRCHVTDRSRASVEPHVGQFNWQLPREPISKLGRKAPRAERSETFAEKRTGARNAKLGRGSPFCPSGRIVLHLLTMNKKRHAMLLLDICLILAVLVYLIISFMLR
jgi:hypothetical protein